MNQNSPVPVAQPAVFWIIWATLLVGVFVIGGIFGDREPAGGVPWIIALGPLVAGLLVRFFLIPRIPTRGKVFPVFIMGLALCESCGVLGVFLASEQRETLLLLSLLGIVTYMPTFVRKLPA